MLTLRDIADALVGTVVLVDEYENFEYHVDLNGADTLPRELYSKKVLTICGEGVDLIYVVLASDGADDVYDEVDFGDYTSEALYLD